MAKTPRNAAANSRAAKQNGASSVDARRLIVELLAEDGPLTLRQLERSVAARLKSAAKPAVEEDVRNLLNWGLVEHDKTPHKFAVSASGHRFLKGARAISAG